MSELAIFFPLFVMGLVSSAHCIGMCGGIMGALTMAIPADAKAKRWMILVAYNLGRIASYTLMGLLAGFFAAQFSALGGGTILRVLAGLLLIAMGLYLADWWRGITRLETLGRYLWVYLQPLGKPLMPVDSIAKGLLLGALWGWLPCGLVYAALASAMTQPAPLLAAGAMLAFGLGTLPAVLAAGVAAQSLARLLQRPNLRRVLAVVIILFGLWVIWGSQAHGDHHAHQHEQMDHSKMDHDAMDHSNMDHSGMNHNEMDHAGMDHSKMDHSAMEQSLPDQSSSSLERQRTDTVEEMSNNVGAVVNHQSSSDSSEAATHQHH